MHVVFRNLSVLHVTPPPPQPRTCASSSSSMPQPASESGSCSRQLRDTTSD